MVNRVLVGAHYGLKDWIIQRVTAVVMALYTIIFLLTLCLVQPASFEAWHGIFANGPMKFISFLFFLSLFYHAWIGMRDIWMDYIKADGLRLVLISATAMALLGYAGWAVQILWRM
ncbi:MAG: succinate dehydrogenase, hydrophobic membrane anchor protein [Pseudomonadota bacterium]